MNETKMTGDFTPAPETAKIDTKVVKKLVGEAIYKVDGVLDAKDSMADLFKSEEDLTRGINVTVSDDQRVEVHAKIVVETGKNIPDIVNEATKAATDTLQNNAGLQVKDICIEVADTMAKDEFRQEYADASAAAAVQPPMPQA